MVDPYELPQISVRRGGITYPGSVEVRGLRGPAHVPLPDTVIAANGWCAPGPCGGEHRWERHVYRPQCGCPQCDTTERYLECAGCTTMVREDEPGFDQLWEGAPWP